MALKYTFIIISILALMTILSGCSNNDRGVEVANYRTGSQGIELEFGTNSPPAIIYAEDESFPVTIELRNRGVYPGEGDGSLPVDVHFIGFDKEIVNGLTDETIMFEEEDARTRYNPEGGLGMVYGEGNVDFGFFQYSNVDSYRANLIAVVCYPYKTFASVDVCVDPDPNSNKMHDSCTPSVTSGGTQGAPVAITSVESVSQRGKARFVINIADVGGGMVLREDAISQCVDQQIPEYDLQKIYVNRVELSNGLAVDCVPNDDIRLIGGRATIVCKAEGLDETQPAYRTLLNIELSYGYKKSIQRQVTIRGD